MLISFFVSIGMKDHNHEEDIFRALFEGSYSVFFSSGLERFVKMMKEIVIVQVSEWSVESQLNVEYYDVIDTIGTIRKEVESDTSKLLNMFMLRKYPAIQGELIYLVAAPSPVCESELKPASTPSDQIVPSTNPTKNPMLQSLIDQV